MTKEKPKQKSEISAIELDRVNVERDNTLVLRDISLSVARGEIVSIVGPNGGGKTTLLHTILGFLKPVSGTLRVLGRSSGRDLPAGSIGYLRQAQSLEKSFPVSVLDVTAMGLLAGKPLGKALKGEARLAVHQALEDVGMLTRASDHFGILSGGQKQRVLIARALAMHPEILLLDEPSTGLDSVAQDSFYRLLSRLRDEKGLTIVLVSHDIGVVSSVSDQVACLNRNIHYHGRPDRNLPAATLAQVFGREVSFLLHDEHCQTCDQE